MAQPAAPHPEERRQDASRRTLDGPPDHGWYSTTLGALSALRAAPIAARRADSTSGTPAPLTPDSAITSRLAARFSLARLLLISSGGTASVLLRPMISGLSISPCP